MADTPTGDTRFEDGGADTREMASSSKLPIPAIEHFLPQHGDPVVPFDEWFTTFQRFLMMVNDGRGVDEKLTASQKNTYLWMMLGAEGRRMFYSHPMRERMDTTGFEAFSTAVKERFQPPANQASACHDFYNHYQGAQESTDEFLTTLRAMAAPCKFGDQCDMQIAIRLICGCHNRDTQVRLLAMPEVKLDEVVKLMQAEERARGYQSTMKKPPQQVSFTRDARGRTRMPDETKPQAESRVRAAARKATASRTINAQRQNRTADFATQSATLSDSASRRKEHLPAEAKKMPSVDET